MSGFIYDPIQFINLIADNLRDRYQSGFPVIKELIQNTDDSKAKDLDFGLSSGIPDASHPLLKGPGIFLINNGEFKPTDARSIRSFGQNTKAADDSSIGKFGLGMKSVFHFCESFFYLGHDGDKSYTEVLNPWSSGEEGSLHAEWDNFTEADAAEIRRHLLDVSARCPSKSETLFVLWLPLRKKTQQILNDGGMSGVIVSEYPGDDPSLLSFFDEEELPVRIAALMPMLRHLERVAFWKVCDKISGTEPDFEVLLNKESTRLLLIDDNKEAHSSDISTSALNGKFKILRRENVSSLVYSGLESYGWNESLRFCHEHELWPSSYIRDEKMHEKEAKDKAKPHGTVFFSRTEGRGQLITNWSVFLPLDEGKTMEKVRCNDDFDYRLTLHGYYFIDAGRQGVHGLSECDDVLIENCTDESSLRKAWNCQLSDSGVFPLVIKALSAFCAEQRLADKSQTSLSEAISNTDLYKNFGDQITAENNWLRVITSQGISWTVRPSSEKVLKIPLPPNNDCGRPWKLFPGLNDIGHKNVLSVYGSANLLNSESDSGWAEEEILILLKSIDINNLFSDSTLLDYLLSFLDEVAGAYLNTLSVQFKLVKLFRQGFKDIGEKALGQSQKKIKDICSHIDNDKCFKVDNDIPKSLLNQLLAAENNVLALPARFFPDNHGGSSLSLEDAYSFLKKVSLCLVETENPSSDLQNACLKVSEQILRAVNADYRSKLLDKCLEMRILGAYNCNLRKRIPVSVNEIESVRKNGLLFGFSQGTTEVARLSLAPLLQKVLVKDPVLVINSETAKLALGSDASVSACDGSSVLKSLGMHKRILGGVDARSALVSALGGQLNSYKDSINENEMRGLRYLLHAKQDHFSYDGALWVLGYEEEQVWTKIWSQLIGSEAGTWKLLNTKIMNSLPRNVWESLIIKEIRSSTVIDDMRQQDLSLINSSAFDEDECETILLTVQDDGLWLSLPFHKTLNGIMVCGDAENVYLAPDDASVDTSGALFCDVDFIGCSSNEELLRRQKNLIKVIDNNAVIKIALTRDDLSGTWLEIMDALQLLDAKAQMLPDDLNQLVVSTGWVPGDKGYCYKPENVVDIEIVNDELDRLFASNTNIFASPLGLDADFVLHPFYAKARKKYFSYDFTGLIKLVEVMPDFDTYHIGNVEFKDELDVKNAANILSSYSHPGWRLLSALTSRFYESKGAEIVNLASSMKGDVELEEVIRLLNWLSKRGNTGKKTIQVYNCYLNVLSNIDNISIKTIGDLKLISQSQNWVNSAELVSGVSGVSKNSLLDNEQAKILEKVIYCDSSPVLQTDTGKENAVNLILESPDKQLRDYFESWDHYVTPAVIGAFVLLFGTEKSIKVFSSDLLHPHSREGVMSKVEWKRLEGSGMSWLTGCTFDEALGYVKKIIVDVSDDKDIEVYSILKKHITVSVSEEIENLIVGRFGTLDGALKITLRKIDPVNFTDKELSEFLQSSMTYMLSEVYNQKNINLDVLWDELDKSDQVDIELAKSLILQNIPFYLKQLGAHKSNTIRTILNNYRDDERKEQEYKGSEKEKEFKEAKETSLKVIQDTIESDDSTKRAILNLVRQKVRDYQYQKESVPFELFQNADDALHDLELINAYPLDPDDKKAEPLPSTICRFVVRAYEGKLVFMHWGRTINQFGSKGYPGREKSFDRDLENMLILSASDKGEGVTGKFGLGFKSVWLISDQPTIVSGRLQTEIVGGLLPLSVQNNVTRELRNQLSTQQLDNNWPGTAIELPLADALSYEVIAPFLSVAGYMVAFSRNIRTIDIVNDGGRDLAVTWDGEQLVGCDNSFIGHIRQSETDSLILKFNLNDGALLIAVGVSGFIDLPKHIPSIWVTAPINEQESLGFAINAMFEVDAGRSRLSASVDENQHQYLASRIGKQLARELEGLRASVDNRWDSIASKLQFKPNIKPYHFWASLWNVLMFNLPQLPKESATRVIATSVLSESLGTMSVKHKIIPNGLSDNLQRLVLLDEIKIVLKDSLLDNNILLAVSKADCFKIILDTSSAITSEMSTWLKLLEIQNKEAFLKWQTVGLLNLFMSLDKNSALSLEDANILGSVLNSETIKKWEQPDADISVKILTDVKLAIGSATDVRFFSADGSAKKVKSMLTKDSTIEEDLRWSFAPEANQLSNDYSKKAIEFYLLCRDKLVAPAEKLKEWILCASDDDRRRAALRYLLEGELSRQVTEELHKTGINGQWLGEIDNNSVYLDDWDEDEKIMLIYHKLKTPEQLMKELDNSEDDQDEEPEQIDPVIALEKIYNWWELNREEYLKRYQLKTYPDGLSVDLADDDIGKIDRSSWLTLFLLGGFHTMGRTLPEQHRKFIENCRNRGWWDVFIAPSPEDNFGDWMGVLDDYVDQQVDQQEHEQWMMRFPIIYKLSRYLDEYIELIQGLDRHSSQFDLNAILTTRTDPSQQGGGISVPPLGRTLGMGANFIVREALRSGVISNEYCEEHAFVPYKGVVQILKEMGCDGPDWSDDRFNASRRMHNYIKENMDAGKFTFCGDFDIPLHIISKDWSLQVELLGRSLSSDEGWI